MLEVDVQSSFRLLIAHKEVSAQRKNLRSRGRWRLKIRCRCVFPAPCSRALHISSLRGGRGRSLYVHPVSEAGPLDQRRFGDQVSDCRAWEAREVMLVVGCCSSMGRVGRVRRGCRLSGLACCLAISARLNSSTLRSTYVDMCRDTLTGMRGEADALSEKAWFGGGGRVEHERVDDLIGREAARKFAPRRMESSAWTRL